MVASAHGPTCTEDNDVTRGAITFDFHNTLAQCDPWFQLETRGLASAYLRWRATHRGRAATTDVEGRADHAYQHLRAQIINSGDEMAAEACVAHVLHGMDIDVGDDLPVGIEQIMRTALTSLAPAPGAVETVRTLADAGVPLAIVSSAVYHPFLEWSLARFNLLDRFRYIATSASAGFYKSRPELFWHALDAVGSQPAQSLHIGDSWRFDVQGARRAGMMTVWLRTGNDRESALNDAADNPPDLLADSLAGLAPELLTIWRARNDQPATQPPDSTPT